MPADIRRKVKRPIEKERPIAPAAPTELRWQAKEGGGGQGQRFYAVIIGGGLIAAGLLALVGQWLGVGVVILGAIAAATSVRLGERERHGAITTEGVTIDQTFRPFNTLRTFWLVETSDGPCLYLEGAGRLGRLYHLPLGETRPETVREWLGSRLPEATDRGEDFGHQLARWLRL